MNGLKDPNQSLKWGVVDEILTHCWPVVSKSWLHLVAGLLWTIAGILLLNFAFGWLRPSGLPRALPFALAGVVLALAIYFFGFSKLAGKNVRRIEQIGGKKTGLFAFQTWTSYPLVVFMIVLGITLRHYAPIPKPLLGILYIGIGGALVLSSLRYYGHLWNGRTTNDGSDA